MKSLWNSFKAAFAMFSKIPMPMVDWKKENIKYMMCFFPFVGTAIGILTWLAGGAVSYTRLTDDAGPGCVYSGFLRKRIYTGKISLSCCFIDKCVKEAGNRRVERSIGRCSSDVYKRQVLWWRMHRIVIRIQIIWCKIRQRNMGD